MRFLRKLTASLALATLAVALASGTTQAQDKVVRIGFQNTATSFC
jgi:hypothetical protein